MMDFLELLINQSARSMMGDQILYQYTFGILMIGVAMAFSGIFAGTLIRRMSFYLLLPVGIATVVSLWFFASPGIVILAYVLASGLLVISESLYKQKRKFDLERILMERRHRIDMEENSGES